MKNEEKDVANKAAKALAEKLQAIIKTNGNAPTTVAPFPHATQTSRDENPKVETTPNEKTSSFASAPTENPAKEKTLVDRTKVVTEHVDTFTAWPQAGERSAEASAYRRVKLSNLPRWANLTVVAALVWGGNIQEIFYKDGYATAEVLFLRSEDCKAYQQDTLNGISCPGEPERIIFVDPHESPDPAHQVVRDFVARGHTRCLRAIPPGHELDFTPQQLVQYANGIAATGSVAFRIDSVMIGPSPSKVSETRPNLSSETWLISLTANGCTISICKRERGNLQLRLAPQ